MLQPPRYRTAEHLPYRKRIAFDVRVFLDYGLEILGIVQV